MNNANTPCNQAAENSESAATNSTAPGATHCGNSTPATTCTATETSAGAALPSPSTAQTTPSAPPSITAAECNQIRATLLTHRIMTHRQHQRGELTRNELKNLIDDIDLSAAIIDRLAIESDTKAGDA